MWKYGYERSVYRKCGGGNELVCLFLCVCFCVSACHRHQQLVRKELQLAKHELNLMRAENINLRVALKLKIGNSGGNQVEKEGSKNAASSCSGRGGHGAKKQDVHPIQPAKSKSSVIVEQKETKVKVENHSDQQGRPRPKYGCRIPNAEIYLDYGVRLPFSLSLLADDTSSYAKALDTQTIPKKPLDVVPKDELEWDDISFDSLSRNGENTPPQSPSTSLENSRPTTLSVSENSADLLKKTKSPRRRNPTLTVCYKVSFISRALAFSIFFSHRARTWQLKRCSLSKHCRNRL